MESAVRLEEAAKFLIGAVATTSGLYLAASKVVAGDGGGVAWATPFVLWALSILALVLVLVPQRYEAGRGEPAAWKAGFLAARKRKYRWLLVGAVLFVVGVLAAVTPLVI